MARPHRRRESECARRRRLPSIGVTEEATMIERRTDEDLDSARRRAVVDHDPAADGDFVYAVTSTGVFCRPSCPSRPDPRRIRFFAGPAEAIAAGFRPCRRCRPAG
jgi:methylphosphotriester-DNA--protein-cysteine methyltransferase